MNPALLGLVTILAGVGGCLLYFWGSNQILDKVVFPARDLDAHEAQANRMRTSIWAAGLVGVIAFVLFCLAHLLELLGINSASGQLTNQAADLLRQEVTSDFLSGLTTTVVAAVIAFGVLYLIVGKGAQSAGQNINRANIVRPWLFLFPAMFALGLYLAYPVFETLRLSLTDRDQGGAFVGLANYNQMMGEPKFWEALRNNLLWLIVVPAASTAFGLLAAQLTDRIKWGSAAKSLIFMPMAISFVGAGVIFKLVYEARPADQNQIGVLNSVWLQFDGGIGSFLFLQVLPAIMLLAFAAIVAYVGWIFVRPIAESKQRGGGAGYVPLRLFVGVAALYLVYLSLTSLVGIFTFDYPYGQPQTWLTIPFWNSFLLMVVLIWIQTGFAMVILSAALRGIPEETVEAAIVDGANPFQIFFKIKVPQIMGTIVVVWTTITITVLKVFDIVFAMTNGQWETQVLANYMFDKLFRANDWGVGSASAIIIMIMVSPILVWNVYNARKEMK